jgi:hypothetical protein
LWRGSRHFVNSIRHKRSSQKFAGDAPAATVKPLQGG